MKTHLLFVYGTLKKGEANHHFLKNASCCGDFQLEADLFNLGKFPALKEGAGTVHGEVYVVDSETLALIDNLEGHPFLFERRNVSLKCGTPVQTYFFQDEFHEVVARVPSGIWKRGK